MDHAPARLQHTAVTGIGLALVLICTASCARQSQRSLDTREVSLQDFSHADPTDAPASAAPVTRAAENSADTQASAAAPLAEAPAEAAPAAPPTSAAAPAPGPAPAPGERLTRPGDQVIVDSVVGQVSGRPIFADAFLEPLEDVLRQEAQQHSPRDFLLRAKQIIDARLNEVVLNELFLAEAQAQLTEQQQMGLLAFLDQFRERTVAEGFGSATQREQELQEERGMTLDEYVELRRNQLLLGNLINQRVQPRVIVSWNDIEREYELRKAEFNPPGTVTLSRIRLPNEQREQIDTVTRRLAAGEPFADIAEALGFPDGGRWETFQMGPGGVSDIAIAEVYKPHLQNIAEGQATPAIEVEGRTVWLHITDIEQPEPKSLYDVQRQLARELELRRGAEQREIYIRSLFERGIYDELEEMSRRVLTVALLRYGR